MHESEICGGSLQLIFIPEISFCDMHVTPSAQETEGVFMSYETTFYYSRVVGRKVYSGEGIYLGRLSDIAVTLTAGKPRALALMVKKGSGLFPVGCSKLAVRQDRGRYTLECGDPRPPQELGEQALYLGRHILDRQLVDMSGRKLVRVNDMRLAVTVAGTFVVAVDVGVEGLLRRLGVAKYLKKLLGLFHVTIPSKLILWDEVEAVDIGHTGIKLSKTYTKLKTLHVSDLADIIEDMNARMRAEVFASLDEERAADVLEELEPDARLKVVSGMSAQKAAALLGKMPADEAADILEVLPEDRAEELLAQMEQEASQEVRELLEYEDDEVGSLMSKDFLSYRKSLSVDDVLADLRRTKPEADSIYSLNIVDEGEKLIASVSLRDIVVAPPGTRLDEIMDPRVIFVRDTDKISSMAELITKYNLLAVPVVDGEMVLSGMVVIDDIVYTLLKSGRRALAKG